MRAIGRGLAATVIAGCVALAGRRVPWRRRWTSSRSRCRSRKRPRRPRQPRQPASHSPSGTCASRRPTRGVACRRALARAGQRPELPALGAAPAWWSIFRVRSQAYARGALRVERPRRQPGACRPLRGSAPHRLRSKSKSAVPAVRQEGATLSQSSRQPRWRRQDGGPPQQLRRRPQTSSTGTSEADARLAAMVDPTSEPASAPIEPPSSPPRHRWP